MTDIIASLSDAELKVLMRQMDSRFKEIRKAEKAMADERRADLGVLGADMFVHMISEMDREESESSAWAGYNEYGIPWEHEGRKYSIGIRITDVLRKEERVEGVDYFPNKKTSPSK